MFRNFHNKILLRGKFEIPLRLAYRKCGYKYVLLNKKKKATYEELVEFQEWWRGYVNRCLVIESDYVTKDSKFTVNFIHTPTNR